MNARCSILFCSIWIVSRSVKKTSKKEGEEIRMDEEKNNYVSLPYYIQYVLCLISYVCGDAKCLMSMSNVYWLILKFKFSIDPALHWYDLELMKSYLDIMLINCRVDQV